MIKSNNLLLRILDLFFQADIFLEKSVQTSLMSYNTALRFHMEQQEKYKVYLEFSPFSLQNHRKAQTCKDIVMTL